MDSTPAMRKEKLWFGKFRLTLAYQLKWNSHSASFLPLQEFSLGSRNLWRNAVPGPGLVSSSNEGTLRRGYKVEALLSWTSTQVNQYDWQLNTLYKITSPGETEGAKKWKSILTTVAFSGGPVMSTVWLVVVVKRQTMMGTILCPGRENSGAKSTQYFS